MTRLALFVLGGCGAEPGDSIAAGGASRSDTDADLVSPTPPAADPGASSPSDPGEALSAASGAGAGVESEDPGGLGFDGGRAARAGAGGAAAMPVPPGDVPRDCTSLPAVTDYAAPGPFGDARMFRNDGPGGNYTLFRPDASLGAGGFKHPIATWGNGITTTPDQYQTTLSLIASHGFVVIACNDTQAERPCLSAGLDWLVEQDTAPGPLQGKLDISREVTIGYSWGGGAAIDAADRPNVAATVSLHGMPPRGATAFADMHSPLLLFTSTGDTFVTAADYVTPTFEQSRVPTFYATLNDPGAGHLYVVDDGAAVCIGSLLGLGACEAAAEERAPTIAWLRYWACADEGAAPFFLGEDCTICTPPWVSQRKQLP